MDTHIRIPNKLKEQLVKLKEQQQLNSIAETIQFLLTNSNVNIDTNDEETIEETEEQQEKVNKVNVNNNSLDEISKLLNNNRVKFDLLGL